jgi:hypothetical protein
MNIVDVGQFHFPFIALHEISSILNTGLSKQALSICVSLCENGVNPEALAVGYM